MQLLPSSPFLKDKREKNYSKMWKTSVICKAVSNFCHDNHYFQCHQAICSANNATMTSPPSYHHHLPNNQFNNNTNTANHCSLASRLSVNMFVSTNTGSFPILKIENRQADQTLPSLAFIFLRYQGLTKTNLNK